MHLDIAKGAVVIRVGHKLQKTHQLIADDFHRIPDIMKQRRKAPAKEKLLPCCREIFRIFHVVHHRAGKRIPIWLVCGIDGKSKNEDIDRMHEMIALLFN
ncbi:hypothetical protein SDC9_181727 [bioreactor metagenome]|uniref:Uncharacterized protein n=1 Tax=bioreactor metagenome TaxID=1076179 RepID=A0A645HDR0_9ZZZZ